MLALLLAVAPWIIFFGGSYVVEQNFMSDGGRGSAMGVVFFSFILGVVSMILSLIAPFIWSTSLFEGLHNSLSKKQVLLLLIFPVGFNAMFFIYSFKFQDFTILAVFTSLLFLISTLYYSYRFYNKLTLNMMPNKVRKQGKPTQ